MNKLIIKNESLSLRCEICHKDDLFDSENNICLRCNGIIINDIINKYDKDLLIKYLHFITGLTQQQIKPYSSLK